MFITDSRSQLIGSETKTRRSIDGFDMNDVGNYAKPEVHGASQSKLARISRRTSLRFVAPTVLNSSIALEMVIYW